MKEFYLLLLSVVLLSTISFGQDLHYAKGDLKTHLKSLNGVQVELLPGIDGSLFPQESKSAINKTNTPPIQSRDNTTLKLDSLISNTQKRSFEYDEHGNVTYALAHRRITNAANWIDTFANEYSYDIHGNEILHIRYLFSPQTNQLQKNFKRTYQFNSENQEIISTGYNWNVDSENWIYTTKSENTYDQNNLVEHVTYVWNSDSDTWKQNTRSKWTFNEDGQATLLESFIYGGSTNVWLNHSRRDYIYNADDLWIQTTMQVWNTINEEWINYQTFLYEYNNAGSVTSVVLQNWNANQIEWVDQSIHEYEYNNSNWLIEHKYRYWNTNQNAWIHSSRFTYQVDDFGNRLESIRYIWIQQSNSWQENSKIVRNVNYDYLTDNLAIPSLPVLYHPFNLGGIHKISNENLYAYSPESNNWIYIEPYHYHYSEIQLTSVEELEISDVLIYPNPTSDKILVSFDGFPDSNLNIQLYDINGRVVLAGIIQSGETIDLSHLAPGAYFYLLRSETNIMRGKVMKL